MHNTGGFPSYERKKQYVFKLLQAFIWILGIVLGFGFSFQTTVYTSSLMLSAANCRLSIVGLLFVLIFPFLISFVLFRLFKPLLVLPILFFKAFSFSCCVFSIVLAFGDAGWLARWLLVFSNSLAVVIYIRFCLRHAAGDNETLKRDFIISLVSVTAIGCIDYFIISPFALMLFNHL